MSTKAALIPRPGGHPAMKVVQDPGAAQTIRRSQVPGEPEWRSLTVLGVVTVLVRLAALPIVMRQKWASGLPGSSDFWWGTDGYIVLARNLVETGRLAFAPDLLPTVHRSPGFPSAIAAAYLLVHSYAVAVLLVNFLSAVATVWAIHSIARRVYTTRAAFWIALCASLYPPAVYYALTSWSETFIAAVFVTYVATSLRGMLERRFVWYLLAGVALAAVLLSKTIFVAAPVAALLVALLFRRQWIYPLLVQFMVAVMLVSPWTMRNHRLVHRPTLALGAGFNLLVGNFMTQHSGGCDSTFHVAMDDAFAYTKERRGISLDHGSVQSVGFFDVPQELDSVFAQLAVEQIRSDPLRFVHKMGVNLLRFWYYAATPARCCLLALLNIPFVLLAVWEFWRQRESASDVVAWVGLTMVGVWVFYAAIIVHSRFFLALMPLILLFALARVGGVRAKAQDHVA